MTTQRRAVPTFDLERSEVAMRESRVGEDAVLGAMRGLAPGIAARADEIEAARRVPPDLVEALTTAGCFRMLVPRSHGGDELDLPASMRVLEELARADVSVAWNVLIGAGTPVLFRLFSRDVFDAMYANGPDVISGGSFQPAGVAVPLDGGYRVTGRWPLASGCQHCDWLVGHCVVDGKGDGSPLMMTIPAEQIEIKDTWHACGLRGTGSHDIVANDVFVPAGRTFALLSENWCLDGPLGHVPMLTFFSCQMAAIAVGIAASALADVTALAADKVPFGHVDVQARDPIFQYQLGAADARLRAACALLNENASNVWATAAAERPLVPAERARVRAATTWVTEAAATVVEMAYRAGGASAVYASSPLQRRLRDMHAITQHVAVRADSFTTAGAVLAGQDTDLSFA